MDVRLLLAAFLGLLASTSSAELAGSPALTPEQADTLARESRGFERFVLVKMRARGVDAKALDPGFRARLRLVIAQAARQAPQEFIAAGQAAFGMGEDDLSRMFLSIERGPEALAAFFREQALLGPLAQEEFQTYAAVPEDVKKRWDAKRTLTQDASFQGVLSDAMGGGSQEGPAVDLRGPAPAAPAGKKTSLKDLKPLTPAR